MSIRGICRATVSVEYLRRDPNASARDNEGYLTGGYNVLTTFKAQKIPLSGEKATWSFGVSDEAVRDLLIITRVPIVDGATFVHNTKLRIDGKVYEIVRPKDFGGHIEAPIKPYQGGITIG